MKIYEIDSAIEALMSEVDETTGEVKFDPDALDALLVQRDKAVDGLICYYKNKLASAAAIKAEEEALAKRRKRDTNAAKRAEQYIEYVLRGEKYKSARNEVTYTKSQQVQTKDWNAWVEWAMQNAPDYLKYKSPDPDKVALAKALKAGESVGDVELVDKLNIQIK